MEITRTLAVYADFRAGLRDGGIVGEDRTAVAVAAQWLARKETGAADTRQVSTAPAPVAGTKALRRVLDHRNVPMRRGNGVDFIHVGALAIEADRHDGARAGRNRRRQLADIHVAGVGFDIDKHRLGADQCNDFGSGHERERRRDHLIARSDIQRHQRDQQRLRAAGHADAVRGADEARELLLQLRDFRTQDVLAVIQHPLYTRIDRLAQRAIL